MRIAILGANGQLGNEVLNFFSNDEAYAFDSKKINITNERVLKKELDRINPDLVINCAAYTAVDDAEINAKKAFSVNKYGVENICKWVKKNDICLIHISTDYVFDGKKSGKYTEKDQTNPLGVYGKSKLEGEQIIQENLEKYIIIRTSWVFGNMGKNFVKKMIELSYERESIKVVDDQFGNPTSTRSIAELIHKISLKIKSNKFKAWGLYHFSNIPVTNWYEFSKNIFKVAKENDVINLFPKLEPCKTNEFPTLAQRPKYSHLCIEKSIKYLGAEKLSWEDELHYFFKNYK